MIRRFAYAACLCAGLFSAPPLAAQEAPEQALARALAAAQAEDWPAALVAARGAGHLGFDIIEWQRLRAGEGAFADYADFVARRAAWPGMELLRKKGEAVLEGARAPEVIAYFAGVAPQTGAGALALIGALQAEGRAPEATAVAEAAWRDLDLSAEEEAAFLADYPDLVSPHHGGRMQALLDRADLAQARRLLDLVTPGTQAVARARIALQARETGVDALIAAVPERMLGSYGLARDRALWRWRVGQEDGAADLILEWSGDAARLGDPGLWADLRQRMARWDLRKGDARRAYKIAARHRLEPGSSDYVELEFLAGFAALKLGDAPVARQHLSAMAASSTIPGSASRAQYWLGRAAAQQGDGAAAQAALRAAAEYPATFYGQLAAERLGQTTPPRFDADPALPDWRAQGFAALPVFQAAELLQGAGDAALAERFVLHLQEGLGAPGTLALIGLARAWNNPHLELVLAKRADFAGTRVMGALFPLPEALRADLGVPPELVLAIARQESEFDPAAQSWVGARGLMQLMPETAKMMAGKLGLEYAPGRLFEPGYNARLGAAYLAGLREEFGASPLLVAAGYNAGPGRPRRWIGEWGDPRGAEADVATWVEMIPFDETRGYVIRVSEAMPVYRARLGLPARPFSDILKGR